MPWPFGLPAAAEEAEAELSLRWKVAALALRPRRSGLPVLPCREPAAEPRRGLPLPAIRRQ